LRTAADILQNVLGTEGMVARIGGDEFVALMPYDYRMDVDVYIQRIKNAQNVLNRDSKKEFYIELSVGYTIFRCDASVDFNDILSRSDEVLYEKKQTRRESVRK